MRYVKVYKWLSGLIALGIFITRFIYGVGNELNSDGDLELTSFGLILTIGTVVFFLLTVFLFLIDQNRQDQGSN